MRILRLGISALVLGLAVAHGAGVAPPRPASDPRASAPAGSEENTSVQEDEETLRTRGPDGSVRDEQRVEQKSKTKKKIDEKTTY